MLITLVATLSPLLYVINTKHKQILQVTTCQPSFAVGIKVWLMSHDLSPVTLLHTNNFLCSQRRICICRSRHEQGFAVRCSYFVMSRQIYSELGSLLVVTASTNLIMPNDTGRPDYWGGLDPTLTPKRQSKDLGFGEIAELPLTCWCTEKKTACRDERTPLVWTNQRIHNTLWPI